MTAASSPLVYEIAAWMMTIFALAVFVHWKKSLGGGQQQGMSALFFCRMPGNGWGLVARAGIINTRIFNG